MNDQQSHYLPRRSPIPPSCTSGTRRPLKNDGTRSPPSTPRRAHSPKQIFERVSLESKCPDKGNVRQFLDELRMRREELATVGVDIDEKDYRSTIISSLPYSLANFASNQLAAAKLYSSTKTITPDTLISLISEEYERQQVQRLRRSGGNGKAKDQDRDEALNVSSSGKSNGKGKFERKPRGVCWNCGEKGLFKDKCPKPAVDKKNDSSKKSSVANVAIESDSEGEGAFFMEPESDSDEDPSDGGYDSDGDETDWFSEVESNKAGSSWDLGSIGVSVTHSSTLTWTRLLLLCLMNLPHL